MFLDLLSIENPRKCSGSYCSLIRISSNQKFSLSVPDSDPDPGRWKYILNLHRRWCIYYNQHIGRVKKSSRLQKRHTGVTKSCSTKKRWTLEKIYCNAATEVTQYIAPNGVAQNDVSYCHAMIGLHGNSLHSSTQTLHCSLQCKAVSSLRNQEIQTCLCKYSYLAI